ncbi:uncharacterized protein METZ01_LOCUS502384, partial [marine metagenome]
VVRAANTSVTVDALQAADIVSASTEQLVVSAGLGNDITNVSGTGGPVLTIDGGGNSDQLAIINTAAGTTRVSPGSTSDSGSVQTPDTAVITSFAGIEAVLLTGASATDDLTLQGTLDNDTITLDGNLASVNDRALVTFASFDDVSLLGFDGDDTFTVDPTSLTGVTTVAVSGGVGQDSLHVLGSSLVDAIGFAPTSSTAAAVTITGAATTNITGTELLLIDGAEGNDTLTVTT